MQEVVQHSKFGSITLDNAKDLLRSVSWKPQDARTAIFYSNQRHTRDVFGEKSGEAFSEYVTSCYTIDSTCT